MPDYLSKSEAELVVRFADHVRRRVASFPPCPLPHGRGSDFGESRRYRARYPDDDDPVGEWSDILEVTAQG